MTIFKLGLEGQLLALSIRACVGCQPDQKEIKTLPVPKPATDVEAQIFSFFKEYDPSSAFVNGFNEYAGKLFIPSRKNLGGFSRRVDELRLKAENEAEL